MKTKWLAGCILLAGAMVLQAQTNDLSAALQKGLFEEEANRNLDAAISNYQSLAAQFDQDRQVAATAIFRLGECYRKLGQTNDAVVQYQRIAREFSDQETLATLSRQNLTALHAAVPPQLMTAPQLPSPADTRDFQQRLLEILARSNADTNEFAQRLRAIQEASLQDSANITAKAAELEAGAVALKTQITNLSGLNREDRRIAIQQNFPNPVLTKLMQDLAETEQKLVSLTNVYAPQSLQVVEATSLVTAINSQIDAQVDGVIKGLQAKLETDLNAAKFLRNQSGPVQAVHAEVSPVTDDEDQEIRRLQAMIQDSPDLINSATSGATPLFQAAGAGWFRVVTFLLDHGANINLKSGGQGAPLHGATENGNKAMVELLLSRGADVNAADGFGRTALHVAAENGFLAVAEVLLAHHADLNARDSQSNGERTPLHLAAERGNVEMLKWLIARGADINARSKNGSTPLGDAASAGQLDSIRVLLAAKADPDNADNYGRTPMSYAAEGNNLEVVKILLAAKADPNGGKLDAPLLCAVHRQNTVAAELLLQAGANPNVKGGMDWQVTIGNIMHGGINPRDRAECTPLYLAISTGQLPMVNLLLKFKADPNDSRTDGRSLLFSALNNNDMLKVLLDGGGKADSHDSGVGWSLLNNAVLENNPAIVQTLLQHGADVNVRNEHIGAQGGFTPLHVAASVGADRKIFELLLDKKADPNLRDDNGATPLDLVKEKQAGYSDPQKKAAAGQLADLLRQHGALDNLPHWDRITVSRPSANFGRTVFRKGTNDWNQFTLFELMAAYYGFVSTKSVPDSAEQEFNPDSYTIQGSLMFPDLEKVTIQRPMANGREWKKINVDLSALFASGDCSRDVRLEWGDQVVIPEADHPIDAGWYGLPDKAKTTLENCLKRQVQLSVNNQITNVVLTLHASRGTSYSVGPYGRIMVRSSQFSLVPVLTGSGLLRTSSDLSHVKVSRRSPATAKKLEWTLDCSGDHAPDLWLRDGDVIEVPEK